MKTNIKGIELGDFAWFLTASKKDIAEETLVDILQLRTEMMNDVFCGIRPSGVGNFKEKLWYKNFVRRKY